MTFPPPLSTLVVSRKGKPHSSNGGQEITTYTVSIFTDDYARTHVGTETFSSKDEVKAYISEKTGVKFSKDMSIETMINEVPYEIIVTKSTIRLEHDGEGYIVRIMVG